MLSGNGRHRRPRQAPALFVTAGVTGAGLAMPLLAAGGAQAADGATWDRVAQCESGGLWSANAGNGYYGGLQLTLETWQEYGGTVLAARPDLASRSQQIEIAEKILADQGPEAWPSCSISAGLLPDDPDVDVPDVPEVPDAEVPDVPEVPETEVPDVPDVPESPDGSTDGSTEDPAEDSTDDGSSDGSADGSTDDGSTDDGSADDSTDETSPEDSTATPSPDGTSGTGSGIGEPSPETTAEPTTPQVPGTDGEGAGKHRGSPDERPRGETDRPSRGKHGAPGESRAEDAYRVRSGDSLSAIAAEYDVQGGWAALYESNREAIGDDPDLIVPGQLLDLRTGGELR